jgi:DNA-binding protein Fis
MEDQKEVIQVSFPRQVDNDDALVQAVRAFVQNDKGPAGGLYERLLAVIEAPLLNEVLRLTYGNQIRAAQLLGLNRNTLRKKMQERDIKPRQRRGQSS